MWIQSVSQGVQVIPYSKDYITDYRQRLGREKDKRTDEDIQPFSSDAFKKELALFHAIFKN